MIYLLYPVPSEPTGRYWPQVVRFAESLQKNPPGVPYWLVLINSNGGLTPPASALFHNFLVFDYSGTGMDVGAQISVARQLDPAQWIVCFNTSAYFKKPGWLKPYADAIAEFGDGLYGSMASFEAHPHLRSTGYACRAGMLAEYPAVIQDKRDCYAFEHGIDISFGDMVERKGLPVKLLLWDGTYDKPDWRKPPNIFRKGDQSNLLTFDQHTDLFDEADAAEKTRLAELSKTT